MKKSFYTIILILASTSYVFAQNAAETLMNKGQGIVLGGYGEVHVNLPEDGNGKVDVHRLVTLLGYNFNDKVQFVSELSLIHI